MASAEDYKAEISRHIDGLLNAVGDFIAEHVTGTQVVPVDPTPPESTNAPPAEPSSAVTGADSTTSTEDTSAGAPPAEEPSGANTAQQDIVPPAPAEDPTPAQEASDEPSSSTSSDVTPPDTGGL